MTENEIRLLLAKAFAKLDRLIMTNTTAESVAQRLDKLEYRMDMLEKRDRIAVVEEEVEADEDIAALRKVAEMLWTVIATADWVSQSQEWRNAAMKGRDNYFAIKNTAWHAFSNQFARENPELADATQKEKTK